MALYVFISDVCRQDVQNQPGLLDGLKAQVEERQNLAGFDFRPPSPFLIKKLRRNLRLVAYSRTFDQDQLLLFLRVFTRGSREYEDFLQGLKRDPQDLVRRFLSPYEGRLQTIYEELTREPPPPRPPEPTEEERAWLYEVFSGSGYEQADDLLVLETEAWVRKVKDERNRDYLVLYREIVEELLDQAYSEQLPAASDNQGIETRWSHTRSHLGVAYLYRPDLRRLLLLEPLHRGHDNVEALLERHRDLLARVQAHDCAELARIAARSYPALIILDEEAWLAIQKDEEANLALSPEEAGLLASIRQLWARDQLNYPLFINGRAGSGKSTMLQYLAADYIEFALQRDMPHPVLYMASSRDLVERARKIVERLLTVHHERLLERRAYDRSKLSERLDRSFVVFHDFLLSLLPEEERRRFPKERYVDYAEFQRLWERDFRKRPEARRISPDIAWHVVRSYIKGMRDRLDDDLDPDEFKTLPQRQKSVSQETYRRVYDHVWLGWYKKLCEEKRYWDDQDLAAYVLERDLARGVECAAIFCDEAQDFTPVELDLIFQMSLFSRRSLSPEEITKVPFVFAGDPLQTINPTGFRWEAVKANFHERFQAVLDPHRRPRVTLVDKELSLNYRSNPGIVRFCNLIQLTRAALLGASDIRPQDPWWVDDPVQVTIVPLDKAVEGLRRRPDFVKIVNCEMGEEAEAVKGDEILKELVPEQVDGVYRNVFSPTRAKGLEFSAVVLYRFGETAPQGFERLLEGKVVLDDSEAEERLPYEYFFNRLYVAASRAKKQLIIVDSEEALQTFWQWARDPELVKHLKGRVKEARLWEGQIAQPILWEEGWWETERVDPRQQAEEYEREGRVKRDPYLLRQAALHYRVAGEDRKADACLAFAAELEKRYADAGDLYLQIERTEDAFRCYWTGREWDRLCKLAANDPAVAARLESRAADFMAQAHPTVLPERFLEDLTRATQDDAWVKRIRGSSTWRLVIQTVVQRLSQAKADSKIPWREIFAALKRLRSEQVVVDRDEFDRHLALIAYRANELNEAINLWEHLSDTERVEYFDAKAQVEPFPNNLVWLGKLNATEEILEQWRKGQHTIRNVADLDPSILHTVVDAALERQDVALAVDLLRYRPDPQRTTRLLPLAMKAEDPGLIQSAAVLAARLLVRTRNWEEAVQAAESGDFSSLLGAQASDLQNTLQATGGIENILRVVVEELAVSRDLASETARASKPVADFLRRTFIPKDGAPDLHGLSPKAVGAAIERAGQIVDALQFYEKLLENASTDEEKRFAAERLVRSLQRHAAYFQRMGDEREAERRALRAQEYLRRYGLDPQKIDEYPKIEVGIVSRGPIQWTYGTLKITWLKTEARLRLEYPARLESVSIDVNKKEMRGEAPFSPSPVKPEQGELAAWEIPGWKVRVSLVAKGADRYAVLHAQHDRLEIPLT